MSDKRQNTILIVEDEVINNKMLKHLLEDEGFNVVSFLDGESAIDYLKNNRPDLIILDLILPDIDGFTICKALKTRRETNLIPIIMLTALSDFKDRINGIMVGANKYITKPFDSLHLVNEINKLLEWKKEIISKNHHYETINFVINSELKYLEQLNKMISNLLMDTKLTEDEVEDMKSGIYEICVNAIEWGNKFNKDAIVKVNYEITNNILKVTIEDEGEGFNFKHYLSGNYKGIEHQELRLKQGKRLGGFGISMTAKSFDSVIYNEKGNIAVLEKDLSKTSQN